MRGWRLLLGVLVLALTLVATGPALLAQEGHEGSSEGHEGSSEGHAAEGQAGQEDPHAGHAHGHGHGEGQKADSTSHLPIQLYSIQAYFEAPWRNPKAPREVAVQAGIVLLLDAALVAWLRRRWWRR